MAIVHIKLEDAPSPEGTATTMVELDFDDDFDPDNPTRAEMSAMAFVKAMSESAASATVTKGGPDGETGPMDVNDWKRDFDTTDDDTNFTR
jgi:hypothetical protein